MKDNQKYSCPMHPEVVSSEPGKCTKCGMNLVLSSEKTMKGGNKNKMKHTKQKSRHEHNGNDHTEHHRMMAEDFKK